MGGLMMKRWGRPGGSGTGTDPYWSSVKLLLSMNGADASTTFTDESPVARGNASVVSSAQVDTAQQKFGSASLLLDGVDDFINFPDSGDWTFTSSDRFTVECWVRFNILTGFQTFAAQWDAQSGGLRSWLFDFPGSANNVLRFAYSTDGANTIAVQGAWTPSANTWYHVAADCDATNKLRIYANGTMIASGSSIPSFFASSDVLRIGSVKLSGGPDNYLNGWMDELRITKGAARYASDGGYSVPTTAFPRG